MSIPSGLGLFTRYGLKDEVGRVLVRPEFDDAIANQFFIVVKKDAHWKLVTGVEPLTLAYDFEDVLLFDNVVWFKTKGKWGAFKDNEELLVAPVYDSISRMEGANIIEARTRGKYEYLSIFGTPISDEVDITQIFGFEMGYSAAVGCVKGSDKEKYYIIMARSAKILRKSFDGEDECLTWMNELREDYVWIRSLDEKF